jgi:hypothetical protein
MMRAGLGAWMTGAACAAVFAGMAMAQEDPVERCRQAATDSERIACLEAALRARTPDAADSVAPRPAPRPDPVSPPAPAASAGPAPVVGLGAEQVEARRERGRPGSGRDEPAVRVQAAIADFREIPYRRLEVTLDNGQVWRQIDGDRQRVVGRMRAGRTYTADVFEGVFDSYRLRINEIARTIQVERIR